MFSPEKSVGFRSERLSDFMDWRFFFSFDCSQRVLLNVNVPELTILNTDVPQGPSNLEMFWLVSH